MKHTIHNNFKQGALLILFVTSYIPLFILIIIRLLSINKDYLYFQTPSKESLYCFVSKFGFSICLMTISLIGLIGLYILLCNLKRDITNGYYVRVENVMNRNSESIGYIATYIVPFIYTDTSSFIDIITFILIMLLIYGIYTRSNMLLINPILNLRYSLFEIEYIYGSDKPRNGLIIIRGHEINEDSEIKIYPIGFKLYYGKERD